MGMALEESIEGMEKLESNGVVAYVESGLLTLVKKLGKISVDYRSNPAGGGGYVVTVGEGGCGSCSC